MNRRFIFFLLLLPAALTTAAAENFDLVTPANKVTIICAADGHKLDSITANLLANDIESVSGYRPLVTTRLSEVRGNVILIGTVHSALIRSLKETAFKRLNRQWECYSHKIISQPFPNIKKALVIAGSDPRGMAYGVFALSEKIGVSPWWWWADVHPEKKKSLSLNISSFTSSPPSVKYRGIFINDEDWGLQPWAAKTFERETGDIGPKTYAKVFELLLRLKANLIWPAMHPSTKAFFHYPGNAKVAEAYQVVIGTSHAEPMLRNNVDEWDEKKRGHFNYVTNKKAVLDYWEQRVKESKNVNAIYTIGMRGVHDSGLEGVKDLKDAVPLLEGIFRDQRDLLRRHRNEQVSAIPQAFTLYKEVLDVYEKGLQVPDDITLVWPDDNYGYIQRLSNAEEQKRAGGAGVYYHASYWGRPHDYLWLSTTHPALIREELTKAYEMKARNIWVLNVGDIKPAEYTLQLFMDIAYHVSPFTDPAYSKKHLTNWTGNIFGAGSAEKISGALWQYYDLAFERRPEFMGWSRTEPTTKTSGTEYNPVAFGDQVQKRIEAYVGLEENVRKLYQTIPANRKDAYFEIVAYPLTGASLMNKKFLYRDKAELYAQLGSPKARHFASLSDSAYRQIKQLTGFYNDTLAGGKWQGIMSMAPRKLPVFDPAITNLSIKPVADDVLIVPEGGLLKDSAGNYRLHAKKLPAFDRWNRQKHFIDLIGRSDTQRLYSVTTTADWIKVPSGGVINRGADEPEQQIWVEIDWQKAPREKLAGQVVIRYGGQKDTIALQADNRHLQELENYHGFVAAGDYIAINAASFSGKKQHGLQEWKVIEGLGSAGKVMEAWPLTYTAKESSTDTAAIRKNAALHYAFFTFEAATASVTITTLPTFPLNDQQGVRYAVSIDDGPLHLFDVKTVGRTEEWKQNVLSNTARRTFKTTLEAGKHSLTVYAIDPGVILDRLFINLGNPQPFYGALPEAVRLHKQKQKIF